METTSTLERESTAAEKTAPRVMPSLVDVVFIALAFAVPALLAVPLPNGAGDLARHLRVGVIMLAEYGPFHQDILSYTVFGQTFVPYEWLSEALYARANRVGGLPAVAILAGLVIATTYALVVAFLRGRSVDLLLGFLLGVLAAATSAVHWLTRPHLFSSLGAIVLIFLLEGPPRSPGLAVLST